MQSKIRSLTLLAVLAAAPLAAQSKFGLVGGVVSSNMKFSDEGFSFEPKSRTSFAAGVSMMGGGGGALTFAPEALYVMKGAQVDLGGEAAFKLAYIEVPLLFRANISSASSMRPFVFGGPTVSYLLSCKVSGESEGVSIEGDCADDGVTEDGEDPFKKMDYGVAFGIGANFGKITLSARYSMGLANINNVDSDGAKVRNKALMLLAGISF